VSVVKGVSARTDAHPFLPRGGPAAGSPYAEARLDPPFKIDCRCKVQMSALPLRPRPSERKRERSETCSFSIEVCRIRPLGLLPNEKDTPEYSRIPLPHRSPDSQDHRKFLGVTRTPKTFSERADHLFDNLENQTVPRYERYVLPDFFLHAAFIFEYICPVSYTDLYALGMETMLHLKSFVDGFGRRLANIGTPHSRGIGRCHSWLFSEYCPQRGSAP
jgi:hypothetical protein